MSTLESQIEELLVLGRTIYQQRSDLQAVFSDPESVPFWLWLQTHGWLEYPEVREASVPLPPSEIQQYVSCGDSWAFLLSGAAIHTLLLRVLAQYGKDLAEVGPVLDFGCGPGRALRFFLRRALDVDFVGADVDPRGVEWCRNNLPFGQFHVNPEHPPTELPASKFGLVYAISVFSHLSEANHLEWLRELARVIRPGGILVATVHGRHALNRATKEESLLQMLDISRSDLEHARSRVERHGLAFVSQPAGHLNHALYGVTFIAEEYVRRSWSSDFDVIGYEASALDDWQDVVVLRLR